MLRGHGGAGGGAGGLLFLERAGKSWRLFPVTNNIHFIEHLLFTKPMSWIRKIKEN